MTQPFEPVLSTAAINGPRWGAQAETWAELPARVSIPAWEVVAEATGIAEGARVLDVCCGSGEFCRLAAARGATVSGIDAARGMIEVARRVVPDADLRVGPMESLPWDDASFDVVTGFNAFQFAADMRGALAEAKRVVRAGGKVAICNWGRPDDSDLMAVLAAVRPLQPPPQQDAHSDPPATGEPGVIEGLAGSAGLDVTKTGEIDVPFELPDQATLERALLAPGAIYAAVQHSGHDVVAAAIVDGAERFRQEDGSYRFRNRFRYVIAEA